MGAFLDFLTYQVQSAPAFLQKPTGQSWNAAWGLLKDAFRIGASDAITARCPLVAPEDALSPLGAERGLEPMPGEDEGAYRQRLVAAWTTWGQSGTIQALASAMVLAGIPAAQITVAQRWSGVSATLPRPLPYPQITVQTWATLPFAESFLLILNAPLPWVAEGTWGDGQLWGDGGTWGSTATIEQVNLIRRCLARYTPAHALCAGIVLVFSGAVPTDGTAYLTPASWGTGPGGVNGSAAYWLP